jgi:H+/Cl- antiporter ClcA
VNPVSERSIRHGSIWIGAILVGLAAVLYSRLIALLQAAFFARFETHSFLMTLASPPLFIAAAFLVRKFAPDAKGSGIPQVLEAIDLGKSETPGTDPWHSSLVSLRTTFIKIFSSALGILGGASIGREGPTVQIASSAFAWVGRVVRRRLPDVDFPSYLTAGAAAGVAAAFNTPLAGITFAIEEVADGLFGSFRQTMMLTVIIAGITAQALSGDYLYFGHPAIHHADMSLIYESLIIGTAAGALGGFFAKLLAHPALVRLPEHWLRRALICGLICAAIGLVTRGRTSGSGYEATRSVLMSQTSDEASIVFPILKFATTVLSYLSGMAGGIFSPSLSIGSGVGISLAKLFHLPDFKVCALIGMVAFFSGAVQAPLTGVIIVMEMTDEHILILPFMVAAYLAQRIGRLFMPVPLYRYLARRGEEA